MRNLLILLSIYAFTTACMRNTDNQPLTGSNWGEIHNASFEKVASSEVKDWISDKGNHVGIHIYDHVAQEGNKSITIYSSEPKSGRWFTKVNVKPWSLYKFTGWIKTDKLIPEKGEGAGFHMGAFGREFEMESDPKYLTGDNDWTEISFQFETGDRIVQFLNAYLTEEGQQVGKRGLIIWN
jgi:alpha-N-arabinofuranosidase